MASAATLLLPLLPLLPPPSSGARCGTWSVLIHCRLWRISETRQPLAAVPALAMTTPFLRRRFSATVDGLSFCTGSGIRKFRSP